MPKTRIEPQATRYRASIPSELMRFAGHDAYSLIIKGESGTGKTSLALALARALDINKDLSYICTKMSPHELLHRHPWAKNFFRITKEATEAEASDTDDDLGVFGDARLDEPSTVFERITTQLMDVRSPMIVVDSWDTVADLLDKENLRMNLKVLQTWRQRANARIIFITDESEETQFDSLADGTVKLTKGFQEGRRIREIIFAKLRGVEIKTPSYFFTLAGGQFSSFEPYSVLENLVTRYQSKPKAGRLGNDDRISTGHKELDSLLGNGFPRKCVVNIRLDATLNLRSSLQFLSMTVLNFLDSNNIVLFESFENEESEDGFIVQDRISRFLRGRERSSRVQIPKVRFSSKAPNYKQSLDAIRKTIVTAKKKYPKKLLLKVMSSGLITRLRENLGEKMVSDLMTFLKWNTDLCIVLTARADDGTQAYLSRISDVSFHTKEMNGVPFLQPQYPWGSLYGIVPSLEKEVGVRIEPMI